MINQLLGWIETWKQARETKKDVFWKFEEVSSKLQGMWIAKQVNGGKLTTRKWKEYLWYFRYKERVGRLKRGEPAFQPDKPMPKFRWGEDKTGDYDEATKLARENNMVLEYTRNADPCGECGSEDLSLQEERRDFHTKRFWIMCDGCGNEGEAEYFFTFFRGSEDKAIRSCVQSWNEDQQ